MSLDKVAKHLAAQGRGPDTTLVHMSPREVGALQSLAKQHGGSLTINPETGLPEAGILDAILPVVAGAGLSMIPGVGPIMAAGIVGGGTALLTKDLNKGLMAGLGAFGGASLAGSLAGAGAAAGSTAAAGEAATAASTLYTPAEVASMQAAGLSPAEITASAADFVGGPTGIGTPNMPFSAATQSALDNPTSAGISEIAKSPGAFFKKNMFPIGAAAAPLLMGGTDGILGGSKPADQNTSTGYIRPYTYSQTRNPNWSPATAGTEPYFKQTMTAQAPVQADQFGATTMAGGGIVALADGGIPALQLAPLGPVDTQRYAAPVRTIAPEVAAYNQQMMGRANQQYNINPLPAALQVPGFDTPTASTSPTTQTPDATKPTDWIDDYYQQMLGRNADPTGRQLIENAIGQSWYDPARDIPDVIRRSEEFKSSGLNSNPTGIEIGKKYTTAPTAAGVAPASTPGGFGYDPATQRYVGGAPVAPTQAAQSEVQRLRAEMDAMRESQQNSDWAAGGAANGGLMNSYAEGGITNAKQAAVQKYMSQAQGSTQGMQQVLALAKAGDYNASVALNQLNDTPNQNYAMGGGISDLGSYSDGGRLLRGPGDGVSDDIPAQIGGRQPARLADGEFVVPARIVSELGNGSTEAGAKRLYDMMNRVQSSREKSIGDGKVAVDSKAYKHLPA